MFNYRILYLLSVCIYCFNISANAQNNKGGNVYAVIVGIKEYQNSVIPGLDYADKDASLFAAYLKSKAGGNVPDEHIKLFTNHEASIAAIYMSLDWLKERAEKDDLVYFYFSGHGDMEIDSAKISRGFLLAYNSPPNNYINNAISVDDINSTANTLTTKNLAKVILITDACRSGKLAGDFYKGKQLTAENLRAVLNNQVRLASCQADELAAEGPSWGNGRGVFSYYLLNGLNGLADQEKDGIIQLKELNTFLDNAFKNDQELIRDKHKQHPVTDGSPLFPLATVDSLTLAEIANGKAQNEKDSSAILAGLPSFKPLTRQPIDYFFELAKSAMLDTVLNFNSYIRINSDTLPLKMIDDLLLPQEKIKREVDSIRIIINATNDTLSKWFDKRLKLSANDRISTEKAYRKDYDSLTKYLKQKQGINDLLYSQLLGVDLNSLGQLKTQLFKNKSIRKRFSDKLIQVVHEKAQDMINAYLKGDVTELEKRQYYYSGNRSYGSLLPSMELAMKLIPTDHQLARIFNVNYRYISGLIDRMQMAINQKKANSMLNSAFVHQYEALKLEPYAPYIHNELGNLLIHKKNYDSASYHFNIAIELSPTWAIPWSNLIRMNLALNKIEQAKQAIRIADSLQPNLAYVNVNAGLIMEKENNWLAAEGYYLNAIAQNNVHYLPYERLGKLYLQTGEYARADSFLFEAEKRKIDFAVNESVFSFGIELGGRWEATRFENEYPACQLDSLNNTPEWETYRQLAKTLRELEMTGENPDAAEKYAKEVIKKSPEILLIHHYQGKKYFSEGKWQLAEDALKTAISNYRPEDAYKGATSYYQPNYGLKEKIKDALIALKVNKKPNAANKFGFTQDDYLRMEPVIAQSCLYNILLYYDYDILEDHYLLAGVYEKKGLFEKAIEEYIRISAIENNRQIEQAQFLHSRLWLEKPKNKMDELERIEFDSKLRSIYEIPVNMGGSLKAAELYERIGEHTKAEEVLLNQVRLNRLAGNTRHKFRSKSHVLYDHSDVYNYYWLDINKSFESATYNFYKRMLALFPRDGEWHEKAGLFLYDRLSLTYNQVPFPERNTFYNYSIGYPYPFTGSVDAHYQYIDENGNLHTEKIQIKLPGTSEEITIDMLYYDPVMESLNFLEQAVKFSGDLQPGFALEEAIADLYCWTGNLDEAIKIYAGLIKMQPNNVELRNKLIDNLELNKKFTAASEQLDSLYERKQILNYQLPKLARYKMLSRQKEKATNLLKGYTPANDMEKNELMALQSRINWLSGNFTVALNYLKDSIHQNIIDEEKDSDETKEQKIKQNEFRLYSMARMYAMLKIDTKAFATLQQALDSGFRYNYVLNHDMAWDKLRKFKKWNLLLDKYVFENPYPESGELKEIMNYNTVEYRIPGSNLNPQE